MASIVTLNQDSPSVQYLCKKDKRLAKVIRMVGPIIYEPHTDNPFPFLIHEIIEQMSWLCRCSVFHAFPLAP